MRAVSQIGTIREGHKWLRREFVGFDGTRRRYRYWYYDPAKKVFFSREDAFNNEGERVKEGPTQTHSAAQLQADNQVAFAVRADLVREATRLHGVMDAEGKRETKVVTAKVQKLARRDAEAAAATARTAAFEALRARLTTEAQLNALGIDHGTGRVFSHSAVRDQFAALGLEGQQLGDAVADVMRARTSFRDNVITRKLVDSGVGNFEGIAAGFKVTAPDGKVFQVRNGYTTTEAPTLTVLWRDFWARNPRHEPEEIVTRATNHARNMWDAARPSINTPRPAVNTNPDPVVTSAAVIGRIHGYDVAVPSFSADGNAFRLRYARAGYLPGGNAERYSVYFSRGQVSFIEIGESGFVPADDDLLTVWDSVAAHAEATAAISAWGSPEQIAQLDAARARRGLPLLPLPPLSATVTGFALPATSQVSSGGFPAITDFTGIGGLTARFFSTLAEHMQSRSMPYPPPPDRMRELGYDGSAGLQVFALINRLSTLGVDKDAVIDILQKAGRLLRAREAPVTEADFRRVAALTPDPNPNYTGSSAPPGYVIRGRPAGEPVFSVSPGGSGYKIAYSDYARGGPAQFEVSVSSTGVGFWDENSRSMFVPSEEDMAALTRTVQAWGTQAQIDQLDAARRSRHAQAAPPAPVGAAAAPAPAPTTQAAPTQADTVASAGGDTPETLTPWQQAALVRLRRNIPYLDTASNRNTYFATPGVSAPTIAQAVAVARARLVAVGFSTAQARRLVQAARDLATSDVAGGSTGGSLSVLANFSNRTQALDYSRASAPTDPMPRAPENVRTDKETIIRRVFERANQPRVVTPRGAYQRRDPRITIAPISDALRREIMSVRYDAQRLRSEGPRAFNQNAVAPVMTGFRARLEIAGATAEEALRIVSGVRSGALADSRAEPRLTFNVGGTPEEVEAAWQRVLHEIPVLPRALRPPAPPRPNSTEAVLGTGPTPAAPIEHAIQTRSVQEARAIMQTIATARIGQMPIERARRVASAYAAAPVARIPFDQLKEVWDRLPSQGMQDFDARVFQGNAPVTNTIDGSTQSVIDAHAMTVKDILRMTGVPDSARRVTITGRDPIYVSAEFTDGTTSGSMSRTLKWDGDGNIHIHNGSYFTSGRHTAAEGPFSGFKMLATEAFMAEKYRRETGKNVKIDTHGARSSTMNGYYSWGQLGMEPAGDGDSARGPNRGGREEGFRQMMSTPAGCAWWRVNGQDQYNYEFDTRPGSYSMKRLEWYARSRWRLPLPDKTPTAIAASIYALRDRLQKSEESDTAAMDEALISVCAFIAPHLDKLLWRTDTDRLADWVKSHGAA
jgi:hypothetical protein